MVAIVVLLGAGGCVGPASDQYRTGKQLVAQGKYDEAVSSFRQAAAQEPGNNDILSSLGDAESLAADRRVVNAEKMLAEGRTADAHLELQIALEYMPAHPRASVMLRRIENGSVASAASKQPAASATPSVASSESGQQTARRESRTPPDQTSITERPPTPKRLPLAQLTEGQHVSKQPSTAHEQRATRKLSDATETRAATTPQPHTPPAAPATEALKPIGKPIRGARAPEDAGTALQPLTKEHAVPTKSVVPKQAKPPHSSPERQVATTKKIVKRESPSSQAKGGAKERTNGKPVVPSSQPSNMEAGKVMRRQEARRTIPASEYRGTVSRDDNRYPKSVQTLGGIIVKVKDVDTSPLTADLEIRVGGAKIRQKNLRIGSGVSIRLDSGQAYRITIVSLDGEQETVHFAMEQVPSE